MSKYKGVSTHSRLTDVDGLIVLELKREEGENNRNPAVPRANLFRIKFVPGGSQTHGKKASRAENEPYLFRLKIAIDILNE
jgi:hypothetical protein